MAMGSLGKITRLSGELFGSVLTFGSVGTSSAPGQISVARLRKILAELQL
jgi:3-dehydroquinate dehydratase-1